MTAEQRGVITVLQQAIGGPGQRQATAWILWHAANLAAALDTDRVWGEADKVQFVATWLQRGTFPAMLQGQHLPGHLDRLGQLIDERGASDSDLAPFACGLDTTDPGFRMFLQAILSPWWGPAVSRGFVRKGGLLDQVLAGWYEQQALAEDDTNLIRWLAAWLE
jgi:hypothetical protein